MTHTKHTPLKPGVDLTCDCEITPDGLIFCPLHAAAPELLEACQAAIDESGGEFVARYLELAEAAIAKAEPK